jgi:transcription antitermination factor NusG
MKLESNRRCWLAAYTRSRHEQQVARQLGQKELEYMLPTYERLIRWSDRIRRVQMPLFPSYIFVHICEDERRTLLETVGIVQLVSVAGRPALLADEEVERLRSCMSGSADVEPHPYLKYWAPGSRQARSIRRMGRYATRKAKFSSSGRKHRADHEVDRGQHSQRRCRTCLTPHRSNVTVASPHE